MLGWQANTRFANKVNLTFAKPRTISFVPASIAVEKRMLWKLEKNLRIAQKRNSCY